MENLKIFIGNLSYEATEEEIRTLLAPYGTIQSIRLTKKKGCAFVEMTTGAEAAAVITALNNTEYMKRNLRVRPELQSKKAKALARKTYKNQKAVIEQERKEKKIADRGTGDLITKKETLSDADSNSK